MDRAFAIADLRTILHDLYPEVEDDRMIRYCEHPMSAVGLVLFSAAIMGTTDAGDLILFTGYSRKFFAAIALNMENNQLWVGGQYAASTWLSSDGTIDHNCFWEHIEVGSGGLGSVGEIWADACFIFWEEHRVWLREAEADAFLAARGLDQGQGDVLRRLQHREEFSFGYPDSAVATRRRPDPSS